MNAEIIAVGTELLLGDIVNTNAQFISQSLAALGIGVYYQTVVGDNVERLHSTLDAAFSHAELVITSGGLGPTDDDLTKETGAKYFGRELHMDEQILKEIEGYFKTQNISMPETNKKQALLPDGAQPLHNGNGTAPGILLETDGKILIMLPGPPSELIPMFNESVLPYLQKKQDKIFVSNSIKFCGIGESALEEALKDLIQNQTNPSIATYAKVEDGVVSVRLTASAESHEAAVNFIEPVKAEIYKRLNEKIYGEDNESLESALAKLLLEKGLMLALAESCTGGMLSSRLVGCSGISGALLEARVTYSNEAKVRLGVRSDTLEKHGAVSKETAMEMAKAIADVSGADIAVSTTGIAGPEGGTEEKPVGLCYIGLYYRGNMSYLELKLKGNREKIRIRAVISALDFVRRTIIMEGM